MAQEGGEGGGMCWQGQCALLCLCVMPFCAQCILPLPYHIVSNSLPLIYVSWLPAIAILLFERRLPTSGYDFYAATSIAIAAVFPHRALPRYVTWYTQLRLFDYYLGVPYSSIFTLLRWVAE